MMPIVHWMVISKEPFRFLIAMQLGNYTLTLLRKYQEAAIHFMPWRDRERVVRAGYMSGSFTNKAERLGFKLYPAEKMENTKLVQGADFVFETMV
jgi:flavin reductase (DIM6/NTAB) family NADH-FMN oxidoreductase RutF